MGIGKWFKKKGEVIGKAIKKGQMKRGKKDCLKKKNKYGENPYDGGCSIERQIHYGIRPESDRPKTTAQKIENFKNALTPIRVQEKSKKEDTADKQTKGVKSGNPQQTKGVKSGNPQQTKGIKNGK